MKSIIEYINESKMEGYFYTTVGTDTTDDEKGAKKAYELYDKFSHNEIDVDTLIKKLIAYGGDQSGDEKETISGRILGKSKDGKYVVAYDQYSGGFDVFTLD